MNRTKAVVLLIAVFIARGTSFLFSKLLLESMAPLAILAVRFTLAFIILSVIFGKRLIKCRQGEICSGFILGILYTVCMIFEMYGLRTVDTGISSLIENMAIVLVPIYMSVLTRKMPRPKTVICALAAVMGVAFLSIAQSRSASGISGIILIIMAAVTYAACIITTDRVSRGGDPIVIGIIQLGTMGILSLIVALITGGMSIPQTGSQWAEMFMLILVCSCFGFALQPLGQKYVEAETAAVLTVVNPFTASIMGILVAGETVTGYKLIGYVLILGALIYYNVEDNINK